MKNILSYSLAIIILISIGWFGHGYYQKQTIPDPEIIIQSITDDMIDSIKATVKPERIEIKGDDVPYIPDGYIPKDSVKVITKRDTVIKQGKEVKTIFHEEKLEFEIYKITGYPFKYKIEAFAPCPVTSADVTHYPNKKYFEELGLKFYREGYVHGLVNYPTRNKAAYFGAGLMVAAITYLILK